MLNTTSDAILSIPAPSTNPFYVSSTPSLITTQTNLTFGNPLTAPKSPGNEIQAIIFNVLTVTLAIATLMVGYLQLRRRYLATPVYTNDTRRDIDLERNGGIHIPLHGAWLTTDQY